MDESLKAKLSLGLVQSQRTELRQELREVWNTRLKGPLSFVPHELRETLTEEQAADANRRFGKFAASYLKGELLNSTLLDRQRRLHQGKFVAGVGFGKGYDFDWVCEADIVGLATLCVDVSDVACEWARGKLLHQWTESPVREVLEPVVLEGEIGELLAGAVGDAHLDQAKIEIWYLCRLIGCLPEDRVGETLALLGRSLGAELDPHGFHKIVMVLAFREDNPNRVAKTSQLYTREKLFKDLERGAERKLRVTRQSPYKYFDQLYTALTIQADMVGGEK